MHTLGYATLEEVCIFMRVVAVVIYVLFREGEKL